MFIDQDKPGVTLAKIFAILAVVLAIAIVAIIFI
jgi:hypothetical protein